MRSYKMTNSGNSIADYTETIIKCENCGGTGRVYINKDLFMNTISGIPFNSMRNKYRRWMDNDNTCQCDECDGIGEHIIFS